MADPISGSILLVTAIVGAGSFAANYALRPKLTAGKIDRGRADDTRIQTVEEGGFIPICYGRRARLAGIGFWGTPTQEHISETPGRSGGKGGGRPPEPATDNYTYTKSFALLICDALPGGAQGRLRKVWEDLEVIYSAVGVDGVNGFYEAEAAGNSLANGAVRAASTLCSGGQKVNLPVSSASVQFNSLDGPGPVDGTLYYISSSSSTLQVVVNNAVVATLSLPSTSGEVGTKEFSVTLPALSNYIRFQGASASIAVDRINLRASGADLPGDTIIPTGLLDPDEPYPDDPDNPRAFYNVAPVIDETTGFQEGMITAGGQAPFEFFTGVETQPQSSIIVSVDGADTTPANRGVCSWITENYQLKTAAVGNFSFEVDPGMSDLAEIMVDLYKQVSKYRMPYKLTDDDLDMSALAGLIVDTLVIDSADGLSAAIDNLQLWYNFDVVDRGDQIVAVLRGGEPVATITEAELAAYEEGQERPLGPVQITYQPGVDAPGLANVSFIDPSPGKDFHNATVPAQLTTGTSVNPVNMNFPIGGTPDQAVAVGLRYLQELQLARRPFQFTTGPKYSHLLPTDPVTLQLSSATHELRLTGVQAALTGLVKARAVPEKASIYQQSLPLPYGTGHEPPVVEFPANTYLWVGDLPPLRLEDDALGRYIAGCKRGEGAWRGYRVYKEELTEEFDRIISGDRPSMIGIVSGVLPSVSDPSVFDYTSSLVVDFFFDNEGIASRTEEEILQRPVNVLAVGLGQNIEIIQFADATPSAASSPYVKRITFTKLLRARNNTEHAVDTHVDGEPCLVLDGSVHFAREDVTEVGATRKLKAVTIGQALADAAEQEEFFNGNSLRPPAPVNPIAIRNAGGDCLMTCTRRSRIAPGLRPNTGVPLAEELEIIEWEIYDDDALLRTLRTTGGPPVPAFWDLIYRNNGAGVADDGSFTVVAASSGTGFGVAVSQQTLRNDFFVEMVFDSGSGAFQFPSIVGLVPAGSVEPNSKASLITPPFYLSRGDTLLSVRAEGLSATQQTIADGDRLAMRGRNGVVEYFINYTHDLSVPFYTSTNVYQFGSPYQLYVSGQSSGSFADADKVHKVRLVSSGTAVWYPADLQAADFGSVQSSIKIRVRQVSAVVGRGRYTEAII